MKKQNHKKIIIPFIIIFVMFISIVAVSYSLFKYKQEDKKLNEVKTGTLNIEYDESKGNSINLLDTYPMTEKEGNSTEPYMFSIKNTGSIDSKYIVKLVKDEEMIKKDNCESKQLSDNLIRYSFTKNNIQTSNLLLSEIESWILDTGEIKTGEMISYDLRFWLDYNAENDTIGKHFHAKVLVEATQSIK